MTNPLRDSKLYLAVKAGLPLIHVVTDDLPHLQEDLAAACDVHTSQIRPIPSADTLKPQPKGIKMAPSTKTVYWASNQVAHSTMEKFEAHGQTVILVGLISPHAQENMAFDAGQVPFNEARFDADISSVHLSAGYDPDTLHRTLAGLTTMEAIRVVKLTAARHDEVSDMTVKETRQWLYGMQKGLSQLSTDLPTYQPPHELDLWLADNGDYFVNPKTSARLVPRGLLFDGPPGTGKTTAAKFLAREMSVPLYRLDLTSALDKYIGVSEQRVAEALSQADRDSPCVLLIDEAEKIFTYGDDDAVPARIMSQLLWWLQEHKSRVLAVMTTNDRSKLPPELYREGRIDAVVKLGYLNHEQGLDLAQRVLLSFGPPGAALKAAHSTALKEVVGALTNMTPASVTEAVLRLVKTRKWA